MGLTLEQAGSLADVLMSELQSRSGAVRTATDYFKGKVPLRFASDQYRSYFEKTYRGFSDNWVSVVAESPVERLAVTGVKAAGEITADAELWGVWQRNGLDADSQLGFLGAGLGARAFCLVWGDPSDPDTPVVTFEDARQAIVQYEPGSRRRRRAALKTWQDGNCEYATLYLRDEVWKLERPHGAEPRKSANLAQAEEMERSWAPRDTGPEPNPQPNPMGMVPMVELPNRPLLADDPISDVSGVIAMQDAVNLLWSQLFTASDFASFPQRVVLGAEPPKTPILDANGQVIGTRPVPLEKFAVDRVLWLSSDKASIGSWPAANLEAYTKVIEVAVGHIAAQTRTPQHYLVGKMANLSGDALIAAETGQVKKVEQKQLWYGQALREVFQLIALAQGDEAKARALAGGTVMWADAESRNMSQLVDALLKLKTIGFPFEYLALRYGLTPTEVADLIAMREREADLDPVAALMNSAQQAQGVRPEPAPTGPADEPVPAG
ncbi:phage portal protein [Kitasatospora sp. A2-31]|uniref:phage portal protein n=1 Tax=Kitasatospora sp. A2-31 TaxID=2916414 RepID=UPI001EEF1526|nr:phage portal protein [Kitasatospora sp. A2-31]MCG6499453.1 phage portal protein [Kitasatospora sp. A2-31]